MERAKAIALSDAGLSTAPVTLAEVKQDFDDGVPNYDPDFYTTAHEYDHEINAQMDAIMDRSTEANERTVYGTKPAATAAPIVVVTEVLRGFIGVDCAKPIAPGHVGVSISSVSFFKVKPDDDDSRGAYKIRFYVGNTEYDCEVDAHSSAMLGANAENG